MHLRKWLSVNTRTEMNAPFAKEEELTQKSGRLKELNILLNMDQKDRELLDGEPEEKNAESFRKEKRKGKIKFVDNFFCGFCPLLVMCYHL